MTSSKKRILSSVVAIFLCLAMISGATFALFTDEAKVNIAVTSGKVDVTAEILTETIKLYSAKAQDGGDLVDENGKTYVHEEVAKFTNGGEATFDANELTLDRVSPGDKVTFDIKVANNSNIAIQYRVKINCTYGADLFYGLEMSVAGEDFTKAIAYTSEWATLMPKEQFTNKTALTEIVPVSLELPIDATNRYQDKTAKITYTVEAVQGNASTDNEYEKEILSAYWSQLAATTAVPAAVNGVITITNAHELAALANSVNAGNNYEGITVVLGNNIDLAGAYWTPIGAYGDYKTSADFSNDDLGRFSGTFDGQEYTVSGLTVAPAASTFALRAAAPVATASGLFGVIDGTVKNLTVKNATVEGTSRVGVVVGCIYPAGTVENVAVESATVTGCKFLGGVVGHAYGDVINASVVDVTLTATPANGTGGDKVGGVIGYLAEGGQKLVDCSAENVTITAYKDAGGIAGCAQTEATVTGNQVKDINITIDQKTGYYGEKAPNAGAVVGYPLCGPLDPSNLADDVTIEETAALVDTMDEFKAAVEAGGEVLVINDVTVSSTINVTKDVVLTVKDGATLSNAGMTAGRMFTVASGAKLTVNVESDKAIELGGYGFVEFPANVTDATVELNGGTFIGDVHSGAFIRLRAGNRNIAVTMNNVEVDVRNNAYIVSTTSDDMDYDFFTLNVNGGSFTSDYRGFELYCTNGSINDAIVTTANGWGIIHGYDDLEVNNCAINATLDGMSSGGVNAAIAVCGEGNLTVNGGSITLCFDEANGQYPWNLTAANVTTSGGFLKMIDVNIDVSDHEDIKVARDDWYGGMRHSLEIWNTVADGFYYGTDYDEVAEGEKAYHITNAAGLKYFADTVNADGKKYNGEKVVLEADVDLKNELWVPIGMNADAQQKFYGTFDGQGHTISNLNVTTPAGYTAAGFFGALNGTAKNFTIRNATINHISTGSATDNGIAVVAGSIYNKGAIDNVHVIDATVTGNRYMGGISGYTYGSVTNCSVTGVTLTATPNLVNGEYDNGDKVGGVVGYFASESVYIVSNNIARDVVITAYRDAGGIIGAGNAANSVLGNRAQGVLITIDQTTNSYGDKAANAGPIIGRVLSGMIDSSNRYASYATETVAVASMDDLRDALLPQEDENGNSVGASQITFTQDVAGAAVTGGYSKSGISQTNGGVIDGNGNTLSVSGANSTWDCAVYTNGGVIKNLTIDSGFRGIFTAGMNQDLYVENVTIDGTVYTFSADGANINYEVVFNKCTLNGWTSYTNGFKHVTFTDCSFGEGSGYAYCRPYNASTFTNCTFEEGFAFDARQNDNIVLVDCYYGDTLITADNITSLLGANAANAIVINN